MASNIKTWKYNPSGTITVQFTDNHSEIMSEAEAIKAGVQGISTGTISSTGTTKKITPTTGITTGLYGASAGTPFSDPNTGQTSNTNFAVPINGQMVPIGTLLQATNDPTKLGQIGKQLKAIGWVSKGTNSQDSITKAYTSLLVKAAAASMDPNEWLAKWKAAGGGLDTAGTSSGGPSTNINLRVYQPNQIQSIAEQVYLNTVGRKPSAKELTDLTTQLNAKEKALPTKTTNIPNATGNVTKTTTTGGVDEQAFIQSQVQSNAALQPEVSRMKDINFSSWLDRAMSGGTAAGGIPNG